MKFSYEELWKKFETAILDTSLDSTNLQFFNIVKNEETYSVVQITGGLNGTGDWEDYFNDLRILVSSLKKQFEKVYLIKIINDCYDDVFYAEIGVK